VKGFRMCNKNLLVKPFVSQRAMDNGLKIAEVKDKKAIIECIVITKDGALSNIGEHAIVRFPMYAADPISLDEGEFLVVNYEDIIMVEDNRESK